MTLEERVGQLVMVPLLAGSDPSSLASTIADEHIGSAILIGNWNTGADTVKTATAQLKDMRRPAIVSSSPPIRRVVRCSI